MEPATVRDRAADLPRDPGVYQFLDGDRVLYVGKAVDLRDRVRSYADAGRGGGADGEPASGPRSERVAEMVRRADDVDVAVTDTETQALLLEANLIKRHRPRYNVRLKDDKSYPLVQLTDHAVPRIEITRDPDEAATVYGPFTDKGRLETVVKAIREVYGLRGCSDHKYSGRDRPCLDYEMGLCTAPCTGEIAEDAYADDVESVRRFFEGETGVLTDPLRREMDRAAQQREFERAANLRDRIEAVEAFAGEGDRAVSDAGDGGGDGRAVDTLGVAVGGDAATVARLHAEGGKLVERERHTLDVPESDGGAIPSVLSAFLTQYYAERSLPDAVLLPEDHGDPEVDAWLDAEGVDVRVPGAGREATLVDLALKNARRGPDDGDATAALAAALALPAADRIEGFDVSHAGGDDVVGANVAFVDGSAATDDYRRKDLAEGNDDYDSMHELIAWRARRAVEGRDDRPDPDLLVIDGGEGQLTAAREALDAAGWDVPAVALAKAEERVVTPDGRRFRDDGDARDLLRRVRDEAHRFAVQYHRTVRDDVSTALDGVPGVGPETRKRLLGRFGGVEAVRSASREELRAVDGVGPETAAAIDDRL